MNTNRVIRNVLAAMAMATAMNAAFAQAGGYNFSYSTEGDKLAMPFQVFDDGKSTYFQFTGKQVPAIFTITGSQRNLIQAQREGMYVVVPTVSSEFVLQAGDEIATVKQAGLGATTVQNDTNLRVVMNDKYAGAEDKKMTEFPNRVEFSTRDKWDQEVNLAKRNDVVLTEQILYVPFAKGKTSLGPSGKKKLEEMLPFTKLAEKIEIKGGPDANSDAQSILRAITVHDYLVGKGIADSKISVSELGNAKRSGSNVFLTEVDIYTAKHQPTKNHDSIDGNSVGTQSLSREQITHEVAEGRITPEQADKLLAGHEREKLLAISEAKQSENTWNASVEQGHLKAVIESWAKKAGWQVSWEIPSDFPIVAGASFHGSFTDAVSAVAKSMENSSMPIRVKFYDSNKVLRILPASGE